MCSARPDTGGELAVSATSAMFLFQMFLFQKMEEGSMEPITTWGY